jgi:hypothetical protein
MPRRLTNLLLLALVAAQIATGVVGWLLPEARALPLYDLHRALGAALLVLVLWKQAIARGSLARRLRRRRWDRSVLIGGAAALVLLTVLGLGLAWTLDLLSFHSLWGYSALNVHVLLGLALLPPLLIWHALRRGERKPPVGALITRRSALRLLGLSAGAVAGWQILSGAAGILSAPGERRTSGSKHAGSFSGNDFPITIWLFDPVPEIDSATWRLTIAGRVARPAALSYADLGALPMESVRAVLDCTSGWWSEQEWTGVRVLDLLAANGVDPAATRLSVRSAARHGWAFALEDLGEALLATHVGGEPLAAGHGFPARLVVPGRRGFQWIKWVDRIEVS